jgi:8-oxo-dGTP pyrophosphatase MutT (NUDIX family)
MSARRTALFRAVGCVVRHGGKLLLLKRAGAKSFPGRWGVPSGKVEENETELQAVVRELFEETGILLSGDQIDLFGTYPVDTHEMAFDYSLFLHIVTGMPSVKLEPTEHSDFGWFTLEETPPFLSS